MNVIKQSIADLEGLLDSLPKTDEEKNKVIEQMMKEYFSEPEHSQRDLAPEVLTQIAKGIYEDYSVFVDSKKEQLKQQIEYLRGISA
ncbi:MAG: hypothetical protein WC511_04920 [Candidatus Pacearchaeota archaeon]